MPNNNEMTVSNLSEAVDDVKEVFDAFKKMDKTSIKDINTLTITLFNMRVQETHLKKPNGIGPITESLANTVKNLDTNINGVITKYKVLLDNSLAMLETYKNILGDMSPEELQSILESRKKNNG
jgi:hypothetical protein